MHHTPPPPEQAWASVLSPKQDGCEDISSKKTKTCIKQSSRQVRHDYQPNNHALFHFFLKSMKHTWLTLCKLRLHVHLPHRTAVRCRAFGPSVGSLWHFWIHGHLRKRRTVEGKGSVRVLLPVTRSKINKSDKSNVSHIQTMEKQSLWRLLHINQSYLDVAGFQYEFKGSKKFHAIIWLLLVDFMRTHSSGLRQIAAHSESGSVWHSLLLKGGIFPAQCWLVFV